MRLDAYLVERGHFESRSRAQGAVKAGLVRINGVVVEKPSANVAEGALVDIAGDVHPYVSRGGVKLEVALRAFDVDPGGRTCLDLGASTGGFTDALLRRGAAKVYAVDVGRGQLHASLRGDPRVINLEETHAANLSRQVVPDEIDILVCDVSFISLKKALPPALALCGRKGRLVALIKPQFEMGRERIGKGGIVAAPPDEVLAMVEEVKGWIEAQGWLVQSVIDSPIAGGDGNKELLLGAIKT